MAQMNKINKNFALKYYLYLNYTNKKETWL